MARFCHRGGAPHHTLSNAGSYLLDLQEKLGGTVPAERFMQEALYNPAFGYYSSRIRTVGRRGDFSTWATLDSSLSLGIATWIKKETPRHVIEIGAGNGELAKDVLRRLGWWTRLRTTYHIVEISAPLRTKQMERLSGFRVIWHDSVEEALQSTNGHAHIFSNELPDAFPCRIFQKTEGGWMELHLHIVDGKISEQLVSATLPESSIFDHPHPLGQRSEIHESYRRWQEAWAPHWMSGAILTIDYGDLSKKLYHRRPAGSLRGYAVQQRLSGNDVFKNPGFCDITADVNFTDLEKWGTNLGWSTETSSTLLAFLKEQGATASLPMPFLEAGEAFRVLIQRRSN